jgi:hypothetical protein
MISFFQLFLAAFAIYSALSYEEEMKLYIPLGCLVFMLIVNRFDKRNIEKKTERRSYLRNEIEKALKKDPAAMKEQEVLTMESILRPKNELLLVDSVHSLLKDLGLKISPGVNYRSVDRILKLPETKKSFGLEILMAEGEVDQNHPKLRKALEFEKERKENEKILLVASTHIRLPLSERKNVNEVSRELADLLLRHHITLVTAHELYDLWQRTKGGENDIFGVFNRLHSHPGGLFSFKGAEDSPFLPRQLPLQ